MNSLLLSLFVYVRDWLILYCCQILVQLVAVVLVCQIQRKGFVKGKLFSFLLKSNNSLLLSFSLSSLNSPACFKSGADAVLSCKFLEGLSSQLTWSLPGLFPLASCSCLLASSDILAYLKYLKYMKMTKKECISYFHILYDPQPTF